MDVAPADVVRDMWEAELAALPPPRDVGPDEQRLARLVAGAAVPIVRADPATTWLWSDPHLGDRVALKAFRWPFRDVAHMDRELLARWRAAVSAGDTLICLGDVAHVDAWRESRFAQDLGACPGERLLVLANRRPATGEAGRPYRGRTVRLDRVSSGAAHRGVGVAASRSASAPDRLNASPSPNRCPGVLEPVAVCSATGESTNPARGTLRWNECYRSAQAR